MAVGSIANKVLGLADEFMEGAVRGIGEAGSIKASVNRVKSNMTKGQVKALKKFGSSADDAAKAVSKSQTIMKNTRQNAVNMIKMSGDDSLSAQRILNMKNSMPLNPARKNHLRGFGKADRISGVQNPTIMNKVGDAVAGGFKDTYTGLKSGKGLGQALSDAYMDGDKLRTGRAVGTFVGASAAARIATGGGLYKDRNGSTNIIGLPFI